MTGGTVMADNGATMPTRQALPQTQLGSRCCHRLPCRRTSIRSPRLATWPRFLVSAARYARAVRRRRQVSRFAPFGSSCDVPPFAPFRSNCPKTLRPSRIAPPLGPESPWNLAFRFVRIVLRRSSLGTAPAEPPEGISSIAICSARPARKLPWHRSVPLGLVRRPTRASRLGRRGRARSSEESQRSRPPAALRRSSAEACYLRCVAAVPLSFPRLPGSMNGVPSRPASVSPESFPVAFWSVRCIVRPSRLHAPFGRSSAAVPTSKPPSFPCGSDTNFEDQVLELSSDFSVNRSRS